MRRLWLLLAAGAAGSRGASAQELPLAPPPPAPRLYVSGNIGLARRQHQPWEAIHLALDPSGWDREYPALQCTPYCAGAADVATGRPLSLTLAVRYRGRRPLHLRAYAGYAPLGTYPGSSGGVQLRIQPTAKVAGVQAAWAFRSLWFALGPSVNVDRAVETAGTSRQVASGVRVGAGFAAGLTFLARRRTFFEVVFERRMAGAVDLVAMPVPGQPTVPAMRVSLSHTVLAVGVGLRR